MNIAADQLRSLIERVEHVQEEIDGLNGDKRDIFAEAKANGFDTKAMKRLIAHRRKEASEVAEEDAIFDLYLRALSELPDAPRVQVHVHAREEAPLHRFDPPHDPRTGELIDPEGPAITTDPGDIPTFLRRGHPVSA